MGGAEFDRARLRRNGCSSLDRAGYVRDFSDKKADDGHRNDGPEFESVVFEVELHGTDTPGKVATYRRVFHPEDDARRA